MLIYWGPVRNRGATSSVPYCLQGGSIHKGSLACLSPCLPRSVFVRLSGQCQLQGAGARTGAGTGAGTGAPSGARLFLLPDSYMECLAVSHAARRRGYTVQF